MRPCERNRFPIPLVLATVALVVLGCGKGSNTVSGPSPGMSQAANIAGTWSGSFQPSDSARCGASAASATFQQSGANFSGNLTTSACGVAGYFEGTVQGNTLTGSIRMAGCTGGGVSGTVGTSGMSLSIGDLTKPLVRGGTAVMAGGALDLRR